MKVASARFKSEKKVDLPVQFSDEDEKFAKKSSLADYNFNHR